MRAERNDNNIDREESIVRSTIIRKKIHLVLVYVVYWARYFSVLVCSLTLTLFLRVLKKFLSDDTK